MSKSGFGENVERTGGTRYAEGKVVLTWLPWRGIYLAWQHADEMVRSVPSPIDGYEVALRADFHLAKAMNLKGTGTGAVGNLAASLYWLLLLCHNLEVRRGESEAVFASFAAEPNLDVLPYPALGVWEIGRVSEYGTEKYAEFDWDQGQAFSILLSSARRHVDKMLAFGPYSVDSNHGDEPEGTRYSGLLHAGHAAWNVACLLDFIEQGRAHELDDVSLWHGITASDKETILDAGASRADAGTPSWKIVREYRDIDRLVVPSSFRPLNEDPPLRGEGPEE